MKYKNAAKILPEELIEKVQEYVQGEYLYIPIREREIQPKMTDYALEVQKRDQHIYSEHLQGISNRELAEMKGWIADAMEDDGWTLVSKELFDGTLENLEKLYNALPVQLIHRDVHFGNFLFEGERFSGYIDFDLSQRNIRVFDLCYFLLGLLCEEEILQVTEEKWFQVLQEVFRGYMGVNELIPQELQAVPYVMKSIEFLFAAWFLGQKDRKCCEDAVSILEFVDANTKRIQNTLRKISRI